MESGESSESDAESEPFQELTPSSDIKERVRRAVLGAPRNLKDPNIFHRISLVAFLAWVGLGADGLSSSSYGPDEAFRELTEHPYLVVALVGAMTLTIFIISYAYSHIVEHFPSGGGGYVVSSKLLGPKFGLASGAALLVDYVFTISVSIASAADQVFSFLPPGLAAYKMELVTIAIILLTIMNLRGVKESVTILMPIFLLFLVTHAILIFGGIGMHIGDAPRVASSLHADFNQGFESVGFLGLLAIFLRAYTRGAGTYTGIEAVSNGTQMMREPRVKTAKRTMAFMAVSLAVTAGGILTLYLLFDVQPEAGKTMNAVLLERFAGLWEIGGIAIGTPFVVLTLVAEALLLFVAAQAGFIGGPQLMSNMAIDSWLPHRFASFSDRLTMQNGVVLISAAALLTLYLTGGNTSALVLMYSINVFLTFSLSMAGMVRFWALNRKKFPDWYRHIAMYIVGLALCFTILIVNIVEKFFEGGWITLVLTGGVVLLCLAIKKRYRIAMSHLSRLDNILSDIPTLPQSAPPPALSPKAPTAVLLVSSFGGLGVHTFLSIQRLFPKHFRNFIFVSVNVVDAGNFKGSAELDNAVAGTKLALRRYVDFAHGLGLAADSRTGVGTEVLDEAETLALEIVKEYPHSVFFAGKLVFQKERWYQR
ncbi:MAG TPA: amino acid permease, partial [Bacteroidota bacterium]|nr:amino acid permease [Bacteroidota bacterium]